MHSPCPQFALLIALSLSHALTRPTGELEDDDDDTTKDVYHFLYKRMKQDAILAKRQLPPQVYTIPGPQEPLPGRSHPSDYWPVFPFQNQFSGGLDLDPSISRHIGGDLNIAVPSWGMLDIYGRFFNRISDTTTKFGYLNHPVNMMDLEKEDFVELMSNPSSHWNRAGQPTLPLGKFAKSFVPISCKPPLCNPYTMNFGLGIEHDYGGSDGVEGDIDVPIPISKGVAYRFPFSGKVYYDYDNITITYGHNINPIDPFHSLFDYQKHRDPGLAIPRDLPYQSRLPLRHKRQVEVINNESESKPVHPEHAPKQKISAIIKQLPSFQIAPPPPGPDPIPTPAEQSDDVQKFYPIGRDASPEDREFKPSPIINDGRFDSPAPPLGMLGPPAAASDLHTLMQSLDTSRLFGPEAQKHIEAQNEQLKKLLVDAVSQQSMNTNAHDYLRLRNERENVLQQLLQQHAVQNRQLEQLLAAQLRDLNLGSLPFQPPPLLKPIIPINQRLYWLY